MKISSRYTLATLGLALAMAFVPILSAQVPGPAEPGQDVQPISRVVAPISNAIRFTLKGNVHPLARPRDDHGPAPSAMPTGRMMLLLRRSDEQAAGLHQYLNELQNPASVNYRKWLTPEAYGRSYGISDADLATVEAWLHAQGFRVERVPAARNLIVFSGTFGTIEKAFHTSIHSYVISGVQHYANAADPQIPAALAPVVAGISPMNDFRFKPQHEIGARGVWDVEAKRIKPLLTLHGGSAANPTNFLFVDPADAATIYNTPNSLLNRNYSATKSLDGTGVTIGIVGYSSLQNEDIQNYRTAFLNDSDPDHLPRIILDETGAFLPGGAGIEALLDNEIAGGLAPGATINYYTSQSTDLADGLTFAALRAIDDNQISIFNVSFGTCEANLGAAGNLVFSELWEQAAAQGISVVVASGDSGSATCDNENEVTVASNGLAVNALASTPYNIAVGGTDFDSLLSSFSTYVDTTNGTPPYYGTAHGHIPESVWNNSVVSNGALLANSAYRDPGSGDTNIVAGGGGKSSAAVCGTSLDQNGGCPGALAGYAKPSFQSSVTASDGVRDIPDVSLFSANGKFNATWVLCSDSTIDGSTSQGGEGYTNCETSNGVFGDNSSFDGVGGTSASAPAFSGMLALISQSLGGQRLGQAGSVLYNLAKGSGSAGIFHSVQGNNSVPCAAGSPDCEANDFLAGYDTGSIYSDAAGLGSLDVSALVSAWDEVAFTATTTTLTAGTSAGSLGTGRISVTHGTPLYFGIGVTPPGVSGIVSLSNTGGVANNTASMSDKVTLAADGTAILSANDLPGGNYTVFAYYDGDATHSASTETPGINVTIAPEQSTTALTFAAYDATTGKRLIGSTFAYGSYGFASAPSYGSQSTRDGQGNIVPDGIATGSTVFFFSDGTSAGAFLDSLGVAQQQLSFYSPSSYNFYAVYNGDSSLASSTSPTRSFTVTQGPTSVAVTPATIASTGPLTIVATVTTDSVAANPSGNMTLTSNGIVTVASPIYGTLPNGTVDDQYTFTLPASALTIGANTITLAYLGDTNYLASSASTSVTLLAPTPSFTLAAPSGGITIAIPGQSGTGTVSLSPANGFTGTVSLSCSFGATVVAAPPTCSVPSTVTISGTASTPVAVAVSTTAGSAANDLPLRRFFTPGGGVALGWLLLITVPAARRRGGMGLSALVMLGLVGATVLTGCGGGSGSGGSNPIQGTPAGSYMATVSGTSGSLVSTVSLTVTVN